MSTLPDIQQTKPNFEIPIQQVGVENVEVPFMLQSRNGNYRNMVANVSMRVSLESDIKGISMSRCLRTLRKHLDEPLNQKLVRKILEDLKNNLETKDVYMRFDFKLPIIKKSIKSNNEFPLFYQCKFEGQLLQDDSFKFFQGVKVQYASYCPCSKALSMHLENEGRGAAPHAQRSFADVLIEGRTNCWIWLEEIVDIVEDAVKVLPYPIIKREDEMTIAAHAWQNPMFVEDAIRAIANGLNKNIKIHDWVVKCVHEESIHTSEAVAMMYKGIKEGFNSKNYFLRR